MLIFSIFQGFHNIKLVRLDFKLSCLKSVIITGNLSIVVELLLLLLIITTTIILVRILLPIIISILLKIHVFYYTEA